MSPEVGKTLTAEGLSEYFERCRGLLIENAHDLSVCDSTEATYNAQSYWLLADGQLKDFKGCGLCNEAES